MREAITLCKAHQVQIGAHPGYPDKANFGRIETGETPEQIYTLTMIQLAKLQQLCKQQDVLLSHIKPHGALYHRLIDDRQAALAFMRAVDEVAPHALVVAFPGSELLALAGKRGRREAFIDRTYTADGKLTPRTEAHAVIDDPQLAAQQAVQFVEQGRADTFCIHGDSPKALAIAAAAHRLLREEGYL